MLHYSDWIYSIIPTNININCLAMNTLLNDREQLEQNMYAAFYIKLC